MWCVNSVAKRGLASTVQYTRRAVLARLLHVCRSIRVRGIQRGLVSHFQQPVPRYAPCCRVCYVSVFRDLGWDDAEAAELRLALQYAAAKCAFPEGAVGVYLGGNPISEEALATLPPREGGDFTGERAVWEDKFCIV